MATKASGTTPNIGLSQWEATDFVCREDFNSDNMLIDMAIGDSCKITYGSYIGTGTYGVNNNNSLIFDFEPKIVLVAHTRGCSIVSNSDLRSMLCIRGAEHATKFGSGFETYLTWEGNILSWHATQAYNNSYIACEQLNKEGIEYFYVALG